MHQIDLIAILSLEVLASYGWHAGHTYFPKKYPS
jgi:hypothetical protein